MNLNQMQFRAFLGGFGLTAVILLTTGSWLINKPIESAKPAAIVAARS